jgi:threonine/homoserine/homoserine lactone efflux protein
MSALGIQHFWVFLAAGIALNLTPGQDTLYIVGRSIAHGRSVGLASALGVCTGGLVHAAAAALGLSAVLTTSAAAFAALKWLGALYLIYLGLRMIVSRPKASGTTKLLQPVVPWAAYRQGILTNITNPKVAMFFLAFLPQFIEPATPHRLAAFLLLGVTFNVTGLIWCLVLALAASRLRAFVSPGTTGANLLPRAAGALFVFLGVRLATSKT